MSEKSKYVPFEKIMGEGKRRGFPEPARIDGRYLRLWFDRNGDLIQNILDTRLAQSSNAQLPALSGEQYFHLSQDVVSHILGLSPLCSR